ncbi:hypothetical protein ACIRED_09590, partial [Streptomyces roseolilacinus]
LKLNDAEEAAAWSMLRAVADGGVTVLAVCTEVPDEADVVIRTTAADPATADPAVATGGDADREDDGDPGEGDGGDRAAKPARDAGGPARDAGDTAQDAGDAGRDAAASGDDTDDEKGAADAFAETGRA